jgi:hypothetical protein
MEIINSKAHLNVNNSIINSVTEISSIQIAEKH